MSEIGKTNLDLISEVDITSRERIACLAARGLSDYSIADIILLSIDHIKAVKESPEFKNKYANEADRIIQEQIDRDEGWDGIETKALETLLETMRFNRDPKFALQTAMIANRAERRAKTGKKDPAIIDASIADRGSNIVILNVNKTYIQNQQNNSVDAVPNKGKIPLKQSDIPSPKLVESILAPAKERERLNRPKEETELELLFKQSGVVFDKDE